MLNFINITRFCKKVVVQQYRTYFLKAFEVFFFFLAVGALNVKFCFLDRFQNNTYTNNII